MGKNNGWMRPPQSFFKENLNDRVHTYACKLWQCFEFLMLLTNFKYCGTPMSSKDWKKESMLYALYTDYSSENTNGDNNNETDNNDEGNDNSSGQAKKRSKTTKPQKPKTKTIDHLEYFGYSKYYNSGLESLLSEIHSEYKDKHNMKNEVYFHKKTKNMPEYESKQIIEENDQTSAPISEDNIIPTTPTTDPMDADNNDNPVPVMASSIDNGDTSIRVASFLLNSINSNISSNNHIENITINEVGGSATNTIVSDDGSTFESINNIVKPKFKLHLIKVPSSISGELNSLIFVLTPIDPNFDAIQLLDHLNESLLPHNLTSSTTTTTNGQGKRGRPRTVKNEDILRSKVYGANRPTTWDSLFNGGCFYNENRYDILKEYPMKCSSITDDTPKHVFETLLSYFYLVEMSCICEDYLSGKDTKEEYEKSLQFFTKQYADAEDSINILSKSSSYKQYYYDYNCPINPNSLFSFENSVRVLHHLERHYLDSRNIPVSISNINNYNIYNHVNIKTVSFTNDYISKNRNNTKLKCFGNNRIISTLSAKNRTNEERTDYGVKIYNYTNIDNFLWMKNSEDDIISGLCNELFPWVKSIYSIPQNVLKYASEIQNEGNKNRSDNNDNDKFYVGNDFNSKFLTLLRNQTKDQDLQENIIINKEPIIYHKYSSWNQMPFNPITHTQSFIPLCRLPVAYNHVSLHGACLLYRYKYMNDLRPTDTNIFSLFKHAFKMKNGKSIFYDQKLYNNIPPCLDQTGDQKWKDFCESNYWRISQKIKKMNEYTVLNREYSISTTIYFHDTFMNDLAVESLKLTKSFVAIIKYYTYMMKNQPELITPYNYFFSHGLGNISFLPTENLTSIHLEDFSKKLVNLKDIKGEDKIKILTALWVGSCLGHMDLTSPLKLHVVIAGDYSVGKSFLLDIFENLLIPGVSIKFSAFTANSLLTNGDSSGSIYWSEESVKMFYNSESVDNDYVNYCKALLSDGNLSKMVCNFNEGLREISHSNHFARCPFVVASNDPAENLNPGIKSRTLCFTLGKALELNHNNNNNPQQQQHYTKVTSTTNSDSRKRTRNSNINNGTSEGLLQKLHHFDEYYDKNNSIYNSRIEKSIDYLNRKYNDDQMMIDSTENSSENVNINNDNTLSEPRDGMMRDDTMSDVVNSNLQYLKEVNRIFEEDIHFLLNKRHCDLITDDNVISFIKNTIISSKAFNDDDNDHNVSNNDQNVDKNDFYQYDSSSTEIKNMKRMYKSIFDNYTIDKDQNNNNSGDKDRNLVNINLIERNLNDDNDDKKKKNGKKSNFDNTNHLFITQRILGSADSFTNYVRFESLVSSLTHFALLEKRMELSSHLFWCLIPQCIHKLVKKYKCKIDNRSVIKMERLAYNLTINKAFREEFMSPIDVYTGKRNKKHFIPFKSYHILDMQPRLFMDIASISEAFTLVSGEFINPWYNQMIMCLFSQKFTSYNDFIKGLMYYQNTIRTRTPRRKVLSELTATTNNNNSNTNNSTESANSSNNSGSNSSNSSKWRQVDNHVNLLKIFESQKSEKDETIIMNIPSMLLISINQNHSTFNQQVGSNNNNNNNSGNNIPQKQPNNNSNNSNSNNTNNNTSKSLFKGCNFVKIKVDLPGKISNTFVDMNYVLIYSIPSRTPYHGSTVVNMSDQITILENFVRSQQFDEKLKSIGNSAIFQLLKKLLQDRITVNHSYVPIEHEKFTNFENALMTNKKESRPNDNLYLQVEIRKKTESFPILSVKSVEIDKDVWQHQIWLCVHSIIKTTTNEFLSSIIKKIINKSSTKESIYSLAISSNKIKQQCYNGNPQDIFYQLQSCNLEKSSFGLKYKTPSDKRDISSKSFIVNNTSKNNEDDSFFYVDYMNDNSKSISKKKKIVKQLEKRQQDSSLVNHNTIQAVGNAHSDSHSPKANVQQQTIKSDGTIINILEKTVNQINKDIMDTTNNDNNNTIVSKEKTTTTNNNNNNVISDTTKKTKAITKTINIEENQKNGKDINLLNSELELYKLTLNKIKNELPLSSIRINIDLNDWAANAHMISTHSSQLKIVDNDVEDTKGKYENGLYYLHTNISSNDITHPTTKITHIDVDKSEEEEQEFRNVKTLSPSYISKKLYKHKWKSNFKNMVCLSFFGG